MPKTPVSLLERLRQPGEQEAWERFVELYAPLLYYWTRRAGLRDEDAADLVQDVFTLLIEKMPDFVYEPSQSFRGWLRTVATNRLRDWQRKLGRQPPTGDAAALNNVAAPNDLETFWEAEYRNCLAARALGVMQAEFELTTWRACWEFVVGGRPAAEVGAELGLSENAVYVAKHRVLCRLRKELEGLVE